MNLSIYMVWHSQQREFLCHCFCDFFGISVVMVKTDAKSMFSRVSFSRPGLSFFSFLYLCHSPTTCYSWVLFLKQFVNFVLSFWLVCVMLKSYMLMHVTFKHSIKQITWAEKIPRRYWNSQNWWLKSLSHAHLWKK